MAWLVHSKFNLEKHLIIKMPSVGKRENISAHFKLHLLEKPNLKSLGLTRDTVKGGREVSWLRTLSEVWLSINHLFLVYNLIFIIWVTMSWSLMYSQICHNIWKNCWTFKRGGVMAIISSSSVGGLEAQVDGTLFCSTLDSGRGKSEH